MPAIDELMRRPSHFIADTEETVDEKTDDDVTGDTPTLRGVDDSSGFIKDTEENPDVPEPTEEQTEKTPEGGFFARLFRRKNIKTQKRVNIYEIREKTSSRAREIISQIIFCLLLALILFSAVFLAFRGKQSHQTFVFDRTFFVG